MMKAAPSLPYRFNSALVPLEIWLHIMSFCPLESLLNFRLVNYQLASLSNQSLRDRWQVKFVDFCAFTRTQQVELKALENQKKPHLVHYRDFLTSPNTAENLTEVTWFSNAPIEVQVVCECLVRLKGGIDQPDDQRLSWSEIRRIMKRQDFKLWLLCLSTNVDFISIGDTRKVEQIIRLDPLITYERLRDVSMAGYRLLILVAASLQYSTIANEINMKRVELSLAEQRLTRLAKFMDAITLNINK